MDACLTCNYPRMFMPDYSHPHCYTCTVCSIDLLCIVLWQHRSYYHNNIQQETAGQKDAHYATFSFNNWFWISIPIKTFGLLQPYFGCLSCMPIVYITNFKRGYQSHSESECNWQASPFVKLVSFLLSEGWWLVFLWPYTSAPGAVPWLHGCGRNARSVTK